MTSFLEKRVHKSKLLVGYSSNNTDVQKLKAKRQLFHDLKYILGSANLTLPVIATREAFVLAQERNEYKIDHKGGVEG